MGCAVTLSQRVRNVGRIASPPTSVRIAGAGGTVRLVPIPRLAPGESVTVAGTLPLPEGRSVALVQLDPWNRVRERVEADNLTRIDVDAARCTPRHVPGRG